MVDYVLVEFFLVEFSLIDFVFAVVVFVVDDVVFFFDYVFEVWSFWIEIDPETMANKWDVMKRKRLNDMLELEQKVRLVWNRQADYQIRIVYIGYYYH